MERTVLQTAAHSTAPPTASATPVSASVTWVTRVMVAKLKCAPTCVRRRASVMAVVASALQGGKEWIVQKDRAQMIAHRMEHADLAHVIATMAGRVKLVTAKCVPMIVLGMAIVSMAPAAAIMDSKASTAPCLNAPMIARTMAGAS